MNRNLYTRPNKPARLTVTHRREVPVQAPRPLPAIVEVDRGSECHITPAPIAARMVEYLGPPGDFLTLEPSAGTGNLIHALYAAGNSCRELTAIERHHALCSVVRERFTGDQYIDPLQRCFLAYAAEMQGRIEYPRIVMNPPFRDVRKHMGAALSLLGCGGHGCATSVALVPITYTHDDAEILEVLDVDTFPTAKVSTKLVRFERFRD